MFLGKAYMTREQYAYEEYNRIRTAAKFDLWLKQMFSKFKEAIEKESYVDVLRLATALKGMEYLIVSTEWAKKESLKETLAYLIKLPGMEENETRYVLYVLMSFSGGWAIDSARGIPLFDADHPGDLERIIYRVYPVKRGEGITVYYHNTISHGYPDRRPLLLGVFKKMHEVLEKSPLYLKPGDHAIKILRTGGLISKIAAKIVPHSIGITIGVGLRKEDMEELPITTLHEELDSIFGVDFMTFMVPLIKLDKIIEGKKREYSLWQKLRKNKDYQSLVYLQKIIWRVPAERMPYTLAKIRDENLNTYQRLLGEEGIELINAIIKNTISQIENVWKLVDESLLRPYSYLEAKGINLNISPIGKMMIPIGLLTILRKPIYDWAYPERLSPAQKIWSRAFPGVETLFRFLLHRAEMYYKLSAFEKIVQSALRSEIKTEMSERMVKVLEQKFGAYRFFKRKVY
ncbi:MAG: hypothetical protein QXL15_02040 [Candidatus Korarchaeota archaeon]